MINDKNNLEEALEFLSDKDRKNTVDALYCELHNTAGMLEGNTAESDVEWLARWLCDGFHPRGFSWLDDNEKRFWLNLSEQCIRGLPLLMSRMAVRYRTYEQTLDVLLRAEWMKEKKDGGTQ